MRRTLQPLLILLLAACQAPTDAPLTPYDGGLSNVTRTYMFKDLGTPGGAVANSFIHISGMNFWGQMVGYVYNNGLYQAWYADAINNVPPTLLPGTAGQNSLAAGINDLGVIAGTAGGQNVRWATYTSSPIPIVIPGVSYAEVADINNAGTIAGTACFASLGNPNACIRNFRLSASGAVTVLETQSGLDSRANAINNSGAVAGGIGLYGAIWPASGTVPTLPPLGGDALDINNYGVVLGPLQTWSAATGLYTFPVPFVGIRLSDKNRVVGQYASPLCIQASAPSGHCGATLRTTDPSSLQFLPLAPGFRAVFASVVNTCGWVGGIATTNQDVPHVVAWKPNQCD